MYIFCLNRTSFGKTDLDMIFVIFFYYSSALFSWSTPRPPKRDTKWTLQYKTVCRFYSYFISKHIISQLFQGQLYDQNKHYFLGAPQDLRNETQNERCSIRWFIDSIRIFSQNTSFHGCFRVSFIVISVLFSWSTPSPPKRDTKWTLQYKTVYRFHSYFLSKHIISRLFQGQLYSHFCIIFLEHPKTSETGHKMNAAV